MRKEKSKYCTCLYYSANALSRIMTKISDDEFAITGLSSSYAFLLMIVNEKPGIQPTEISHQMQLTPSTVTRLIEKMEHRNYLERKTVGRTTEVYPTKQAKELHPKIREAWANLYNRYSTVLGKEFSKQLTADIYKATQKL
ncbi:MAG: MarR family transcriptional regulator [Bacteroidota bacterium]